MRLDIGSKGGDVLAPRPTEIKKQRGLLLRFRQSNIGTKLPRGEDGLRQGGPKIPSARQLLKRAWRHLV